jgi:hypothetical protein
LLIKNSDNELFQATIGYSPGCGFIAPSADSVRAFQSIAQAALLSGKNARVYYTTCSSVKWITDITLFQ